jgi:hypothetical protein
VIARDRVIAVIGEAILDRTYNLVNSESDHPIDGQGKNRIFDRGAQ